MHDCHYTLLAFLLLAVLVLQSSAVPLQPKFDELTYCGISQYHRNFDEFASLHYRSKRVVNGVESRDSEWPWMVSLTLQSNGSLNGHVCGGTLIARRWVLTAAHCFESELDASLTDNPDVWTANIGEHNLNEDRVEDYEVEDIIPHPDRNVGNGSLNTDVALVKLASPVQLGKHVNVACLPDVYDNEFPEDGQECIVAGWGHVTARNTSEEEQAAPSDVLRHARVPIFNRDACIVAYQYLNAEIAPFHLDISRDNLCAGFPEGGTDSCQYDSGGPLMCEFNGMLKLSGIVSLGSGCAQKGYPGLYADVTKYLSWIEQTLHNSVRQDPPYDVYE